MPEITAKDRRWAGLAQPGPFRELSISALLNVTLIGGCNRIGYGKPSSVLIIGC